MASIFTLVLTQAQAAKADEAAVSEAMRRKFWNHFTEWKLNASDEELVQLQQALDAFTTHEVVGISRLMRQILADEQRRRMLPPSLVAQLEAVNWPAAQANG